MEAVGAVSAVVQVVILLADKVLSQVNHRALKNGSMEDVKQLKDLLSQFKSFIRDQEENQQENRQTQVLVTKVVRVTADIEDALDEFMVAVPVHFHTTRVVQALSDAKHRLTDLKPMKELAKQTVKIKKHIEEHKLLGQILIKATVGEASSSRRSEDPLTHEFLVEDEIVGFTKRRDDLVQQLVSTANSKRAMIQVVGPGGSGKTFIVKKVIQDPRVKSSFQCVARISMSRSFNADADRSIWVKELLTQVCSERDQRISEEAGNMEQKLQGYLEDKRYIVFLDNVWKKQHYTPIVNLLPNNNMGSRIIITSRNSGLVDNPDYTHKLDGLIEEEAMNLFCVRAFRDQRGDTCPSALKLVMEKILKRCEGMPLAIAAVGSLLCKEQLIKGTWEKFHDRLGSELGSTSSLPIVSRILQPSFVDLPDEHRSCFLYFSMFPENQPVSRGRLIRSWMAEGFLKQDNLKTPEEVAESYLNELVGRSLVRVSECDIDGRARRCQILRLHHEFIVPLSDSGNFVTVIGRDVEQEHTVNEKARRLSVQCDDFPAKLSQIADLGLVRTLFVFGNLNATPKESNSLRSRMKEKFHSDEFDKVFAKFRLIKVLDLQKVPLQKLPRVVGSFTLLRCLNLRHTKLETVPSTVETLVHLETLDLKKTLVKKLPEWIKKLRNLRHLVVSWLEGSPIIEKGVIASSSSIQGLCNLQKLSLVSVNHNVFNFEDLGDLKQLKKLGVVDLVGHNCGKKLCNAVEKMTNLSKFNVKSTTNGFLSLDHMKNPPTHIQSLRFEGHVGTLPSWLSKLSSLVKVVLRRSGVSQNPFNSLEDLPSLMELEMVEYYTGTRMTFKAGTFKNLRKLHVEQLNSLVEVVVENQALVKLKSVTICKCWNLRPLARSSPLGRLEDLVVYEMSEEFITDMQRRIDDIELVDHIRRRSSPLNRGEIRSRRYVS